MGILFLVDPIRLNFSLFDEAHLHVITNHSVTLHFLLARTRAGWKILHSCTSYVIQAYIINIHLVRCGEQKTGCSCTAEHVIDVTEYFLFQKDQWKWDILFPQDRDSKSTLKTGYHRLKSTSKLLMKWQEYNLRFLVHLVPGCYLALLKNSFPHTANPHLKKKSITNSLTA